MATSEELETYSDFIVDDVTSAKNESLVEKTSKRRKKPDNTKIKKSKENKEEKLKKKKKKDIKHDETASKDFDKGCKGAGQNAKDLQNVDSCSECGEQNVKAKVIGEIARDDKKVTHVMAFDVRRESSTKTLKKKGKQSKNFGEQKKEHPEMLEDVLRNFSAKIGLDLFYPEKLQLSDVVKVVSKSEHVHLTQLGVYFLRNLIMLNFLSRDKMIQDFLRHVSKASQPEKSKKNFDFLDDLLGNDIDDISVSPLDLIHCVFRCSSPILQQVIASKLFMCKLAVPLILPPLSGDQCEISMWPLRSITIESRTNDSITQDNAVTCPCHVVSFVRMGRPAFSKSKLMNDIVTDQYHSIFFNKDCPLGTAERVISEGLVETSWYLPSKQSSILTHVTMFLNMRGNSANLEDQMNILLQLSDVLVIVLDVERLTDDLTVKEIVDMQKSKIRILLVFDTKRHNRHYIKEHLQRFIGVFPETKSRPGIYILSKDGEDKSTALIKEELHQQIQDLLKEKSVAKFIDRIDKCTIDENKTVFQRTRQNAEEFMKQIQDNNIIIKDKIVPLQGKLWHSWTKKVKEVNKSSQNLTLQEKGKKRKKMLKYRKEQAKICENLEISMQTFLSRLKSPENEMCLFITWLKVYLDELSRKSIPKFLMTYQSDWQKLMTIKDKEDVDQNTKQSLRKALIESEARLADASFGFEHLFREMGQIFEALENPIEKRKDLMKLRKSLPKIAASLIFEGQPFEIMDGDVGNVPISWVKAVLERLKKRLGNKRLLALSVLGIQSSGKSTLLNAMFGLQFAVSAGRCTRGVYMQMVAVEGNELPFDYVLVIDTEGLRAPELANEKYSHDNELATFVIGLGDITIVNIKGENTAEIKDVLQIAVHAFLRLRLANQGLNLKQTCIFVHQNVPALDANDKMMHGRQKFIETLDEMTKEAADQEGITGIQSFNQVIEFDSETNVWYFSDLWNGDPPMAPVNPGYSENVSLVKDAILYRLTKGRRTYLTISDTISRIEDLWNGILKDDFVFSFRNSLEFKAYASIEKKCQDLIWELEKFVFEFERSEARLILINCKTDDELDQAVDQIKEKLITEVEQLVLRLLDQLNAYIESSSLQDVMIQWKQTKINRIDSKKTGLLDNAKQEINKSKEEVKINNMQSSQQRRHEIEITKKATELAMKMKGKPPSEQKVEEMFDKWWTKCLSSLNVQDNETEQNILSKIKSQIWETYPHLTKFLSDDWQSSTEFEYSKYLHLQDSLPSSFITDNCIEVHSYFVGLIKRDSKKVCKAQAFEITNWILQKIDTKLHLHHAEDLKFHISYVNEILQIIDDSISEHNTNKKKNFHFNFLSPYQSRLICHVACFASIFYANLHEAYNKKHSPKARLQAFKSTVWDFFKNTVNSKTEDVIALGFFKEALVRETIIYVNQLLPMETIDMIWSKFSNGKYSLIKGMLTDERVINDFRQLRQYIMDPSRFAEKWITKLIDEMLFDTEIKGNASPYFKLAEKRIKRIFVSLTRGISQATDSADYGIRGWLHKFVGHIRESKELPLSIDVFVHVEQRKITHSKSFGQMVLDELDNIEKSVLDKFRSTTAGTVKWTVHPVSGIMRKLWGCTAKCMFCNEPCMNTDDSHTGFPHKCLQHRPQGVSGWHCIESEKLIVDFCNHSVQSENTYRMSKEEKNRPYREYKKEFPNWDIAPNSDESKYWMYILCRYKNDIIKKNNLKEPDIPTHWWDISKEEAINSL